MQHNAKVSIMLNSILRSTMCLQMGCNAVAIFNRYRNPQQISIAHRENRKRFLSELVLQKGFRLIRLNLERK